MGRWKISSIFSCFTPSASIPETVHPSAPLAILHSQSTAPVADPSSSTSAAPSSSTPSSSVRKEPDYTKQISGAVDVVDAVDTPSIARLDVPSSSSVLKEPDHTKQISGAVGAVDPGNVNADLNDSSSVLKEPDHTNQISGAAGAVDPGNVNADLNDSSSVLKEPDHTKQIIGAAGAVDPGNVNADLNDLGNYISQYLKFIKGDGDKPSPVSATKRDWPGSKCWFKLKDVLSEGAQIFKDACPDAKKIAQRFLEGMGAVHVLTTGFLVVANIMERCEQIKYNKSECVSLLEKMNTLIQYVKQLQKNPGLKERMETQILKAIMLIVEVTLACCTQINGDKYKFFSTDVNRQDLVNLGNKLSELRNEIQMQMGLYAIEQLDKLLPKEPLYPKYPRAYGIQNQVENVIRLLQWESDKTGIAVILYGLGGMGKTTLADAVFATLRAQKMEGRKYSFVRLFENMGSVPNIPELQTCILRDLKMGEVSAIPKIQRYNEGQNEIAVMLEEKEAFIYIDGVLFPDKVEQGRDAIEELLPTNMRNAKKLRLLITARDKGAAGGVCKERGLKTNFYPIETLPDNEARMLVNEKLDGEEEIIDSSQINQIVDICGGIPGLLIQVARFIGRSQDKQEAQTRYEMVISERKNKWNGEIGKEIGRYVFAYEYFDEILRDPFLDICSYFQGWQWEELSNIFADGKLNSLENIALVTKDVRSMTARVHKVILAIGLKRTEGERFKFTSRNEFQDFLNKKTKKDLRRIKGIWSNDNIGPLDIPASKLNLMCGSLRVLALQNSTKVSGRCNRTFEELFFFSAEISHNPFDLSKVKKLRHLCYSPDDFHNLCQMPPNLISNLRIRQLRLCGSIELLPESIGQFKLLDSIDLSSTDLKKLPDGFCSLSSLKKLVMDNCWSLEELPDGFGNLGSLRKLSLSGCVSLKKLPETFSQLKLLEDLNLSCCVTLEELCAGFKSVSSLRILLLGTCRMLEKLPQDFHCLTLLEHLCLSDCDKLEGTPMGSIVKMETLRTVDIQRSPLLREAWQNIKEGCNQWSHKVGRTSGQGSSTAESMEHRAWSVYGMW